MTLSGKSATNCERSICSLTIRRRRHTKIFDASRSRSTQPRQSFRRAAKFTLLTGQAITPAASSNLQQSAFSTRHSLVKEPGRFRPQLRLESHLCVYGRAPGRVAQFIPTKFEISPTVAFGKSKNQRHGIK